MYRSRMSRSASKRSFRSGANRLHKRNLNTPSFVSRGGVRL